MSGVNPASVDVVLPAGVIHLRCDNPGPMTLTGTNTYVVCLAPGHVAVIDPGPDDAGHRAAIVAAVDRMGETSAGGVRDVAVLLTHHHDDHAGGVESLSAVLSVRGVTVRVWGGSRGTAISGHERLGDLQLVKAPGHTADSAAFLLVREDAAVLFSGDTLLGGSSSFIAHPDGDLTAYLETLDVLARLMRPWPTAQLAPGHGYVGGAARGAIEQYRTHRRARLAEVRSALEGFDDLERGEPTKNIEDDPRLGIVIDAVYAGLDPALRPAIEAVVRAQLAHLDRERSRG